MDESVAAEYDRLGVVEGGETSSRPCFQLDAVSNADFQLCSTYPALLALPSTATPDMLFAVAAHRSRGRLPALTWRDPSLAAGALVRCAQPQQGVLGKADAHIDERFVKSILDCAGGGENRRLVIFDCRSYAAAQANKLRGGGVETSRRYAVRSVEFACLRNVHHVRRVLLRLRAASAEGHTATPAHHKWHRLQSCLLRASARVARLLQSGAAVLLHCSDGWDRTPQVASLSQLILDPHYRVRASDLQPVVPPIKSSVLYPPPLFPPVHRPVHQAAQARAHARIPRSQTVRGLLLLIEKDWLRFGHRFHLRHRLGQPIFLQFLDAVYQLVAQQPDGFGFTPRLLADVLAVHDGAPPSGRDVALPRFPFDKDCDAERAGSAAQAHARGAADEHWASFFVDDPARLATYTNASYVPGGGLALLHADTRPTAMRLWELVRTPPLGALPTRGSQVAVSFALCCPRRSQDLQRMIEAEEEAAGARQSAAPGELELARHA